LKTSRPRLLASVAIGLLFGLVWGWVSGSVVQSYQFGPLGQLGWHMLGFFLGILCMGVIARRLDPFGWRRLRARDER